MAKGKSIQARKKLGGPKVDGGHRRDKVAAVDDLSQRLSGATAVILTEYRGMTVTELAELRTGLREAGAEYKVYKNTLAKIAAKNSGVEELAEHLGGPTAFTFVSGDVALAAKRLSEFAKKVPALVLKGGILEQRVIGATDVNKLASLEPREVLLAKTAGLLISPIQQVANLLAAGFNQFGSLLVQLKDKLPAEGAAPAAPAAEAPAAEAAAEAPAAEAAAEAPAAEAGAEPAADGSTEEQAPAEQAETPAQPEADGGDATDGTE